MASNKPTPYAFAPTRSGGTLPWELGKPENQVEPESNSISGCTDSELSFSVPSFSSSTGEVGHAGYVPGQLFQRYLEARNHSNSQSAAVSATTTPTTSCTTTTTTPMTTTTTRPCACHNCVEMPLRIERKCCLEEGLDNTHLPDFHEGVCLLNCEDIQHAIGKVNVRCSWMDQRRFAGFSGPALAFSTMTNRNYRQNAYRQYIHYIHGLLGRHVRKVIPACIVNHIRTTWPSPDGLYTGFKQVTEDGEEVPVDELEEL